MPVSGPAAPQRVFLTADAVGGVWSYALELARGLSERGIAVQLAVLGPGPCKAQLAAAAAIPRLSIAATGLPLDWNARSEREVQRSTNGLKALARDFNADLVHLYAPALAGAKPWTVPLVVSMHSCLATWWAANKTGPMPADFVWRTRRTLMGMMIADAIVAPSRSFAAEVERLYGEGVAVSAVLNGRQPVELPPAPKESMIFTAGRLWDEGKNVGAIGDAASRIEWPVYAAGAVKGPNGARSKFSNLKLLGSLSPLEMARWYQRASIFVSASRYEPFGLTVLEAAQAGAALVLSDIPTFRELWSDAALFVPLDDGDALTLTLAELAARPQMRELWAGRAKKRARVYTAERMVKATLDIYSGLISAPYVQAVG